MPSQISRRGVRFLMKVSVLLTTLLTAKCDSLQQPTRVPGSEHLIVQTDFPYVYWRPSGRPYTPAVPSTPTSTPTSYGYYYGESRKDHNIDVSTWQMLPIQIPNDLVGAVNERTTRMTTPAPTYPTPATPQYGRYPGVTEQPHLFHPERLYGHFRDQDNFKFQDSKTPNRPRYPNHQHSSQEEVKDHNLEPFQIPQPPQRPNWPKNPQTPWHQSLFDQLEPFIGITHLPKMPNLPKFPNMPSINSITTLPNLPTWPFLSFSNEEEQGYSKPTVDEETDKFDIEVTGDHPLHQFFPIANPTATKKRRKNKRPNQFFSDDQPTVILSTPITYDVLQSAGETNLQTASQNFEAIDRLPSSGNQDSSGNQNSFFDNPFQFIKKQIRPMNIRKQPVLNRRRPIRRNQFQNRPMNNPRFPPNSNNNPLADELLPLPNNNRPINNRYRPNPQNLHPFRQPRPKPYQIHGSNPAPHVQNPPHPHDENYQTKPTGIRRRKPNLNVAASDESDIEYDDYEVIDRLTDLNPLSSSVALPGGMLVVALALALFYFNFVWYPTPVVTARLIKLISDSAPDNLLDSEKQKAIGELYEVFRSLEAGYMQDPDLWQPSCKTRLVCQVHQELPGLWQVTHTYEAVVRSSLATGPQGTNDLNIFLKAAEEGNQGSNCNDLYKSCVMTPVPIRASLQNLLGIGEENVSKVVYS